jgi:hypothetical protein
VAGSTALQALAALGRVAAIQEGWKPVRKAWRKIVQEADKGRRPAVRRPLDQVEISRECALKGSRALGPKGLEAT